MKKRKLLAFELEYAGRTRKEIELATQYRENTLNAYFAKNGLWCDEYNKWCDDNNREAYRVSRIRITRATEKAIDVLTELLGMVKENPAVAQRAAMAILDYAGFSKNGKSLAEPEKPRDIAEEITQWFKNNGSQRNYGINR